MLHHDVDVHGVHGVHGDNILKLLSEAIFKHPRLSSLKYPR